MIPYYTIYHIQSVRMLDYKATRIVNYKSCQVTALQGISWRSSFECYLKLSSTVNFPNLYCSLVHCILVIALLSLSRDPDTKLNFRN